MVSIVINQIPRPRSDGKRTRQVRSRQRARRHRRECWARDQLSPFEAKCHWCPRILTPLSFTIDHVVPLAENGPDTLDNIVLACLECNQRRDRVEVQRRLLRLKAQQEVLKQ